MKTAEPKKVKLSKK